MNLFGTMKPCLKDAWMHVCTWRLLRNPHLGLKINFPMATITNTPMINLINF